jgi:hypothetical protein
MSRPIHQSIYALRSNVEGLKKMKEEDERQLKNLRTLMLSLTGDELKNAKDLEKTICNGLYEKTSGLVDIIKSQEEKLHWREIRHSLLQKIKEDV